MDDYWDVVGPTIPNDSAEQYTSFRLAQRALADRRSLRILDLGCGDGRGVDFFRSLDKDIDYVGVDIAVSPEVASRQRADARFDTFDGVNLTYEDESFDVVFSHQVFEHVANPLKLLQSVQRVLKPDGLFIGSASQLEPYHSFSLWNFTLYGWCKLVAAAGMKVQEFRPAIDGLTLMYRSYDGRRERFSKYFSTESPLNLRIQRRADASGQSVKQIAHRKIVYSGHLVFLAGKEGTSSGNPEVALSSEPEIRELSPRAKRMGGPERDGVDQVPMLTCPICGSHKFGDYRSRKRARCAGCGSMERTRLLALVLRELAPAPTGAPVVHFAPEPALMTVLMERFGRAYIPSDFDVTQYDWVTQPMQTIDLSNPLAHLQPESVQGLVHAHVLEHVPGDLNRIVRQMNETIAPGGFHTFCVPFFSKSYREDMDPGMSREERERLFGQFDHVRSFGTEDFEERVLSLFQGFERVKIAEGITRQKVIEASIPAGAIDALNSHTVFHFIKQA